MSQYRLPRLHGAAVLWTMSLLCSAQAQTAAPISAPKPAQVTTPAPAAPAPPPAPITPPLRRPMVETQSPAEQLEQALYNRDAAKATRLLQADPTLAKGLLPDGASPLVLGVRNYYGYENGSKSLVQLLLDNGADVNKPDRSGTTPLHAALTRGLDEAGITLLLLDKGADPKALNADGENALHLAVRNREINAVKLLLSHGADVNSRTQTGDTPLHLAITSRTPDMIDTLIEAGANINLRNNQGDIPIHLAMRLITLQPPAAVANPVSAVPNPFQTPPSFSSFGPNPKWTGTNPFAVPGSRELPDKRRSNPLLVPQLLEHGAQINARDQTGMTPLLFAILNRDKINQAVLIQHHAALDTLTAVMNAAANDDAATLAHLIKTLPDFKDLRAPNGMTALHVAALWNSPRAVRLLLHSGLEINARNAAAETPLHEACWFPENGPMVSLLLDAGANINAEDVFGETPLHMAVHTRSAELTRLLLARKAATDLPNATGMTPLSLALSTTPLSSARSLPSESPALDSESTDLAKLLLNAGANPNIRVRNGYSLMSYAVGSRNVPIATLLLTKGADANYLSETSDENLLMQAVRVGDKDMVALLLDKGADVNYKNHTGQTALILAGNSYYNNTGIADLLIQHGAK